MLNYQLDITNLFQSGFSGRSRHYWIGETLLGTALTIKNRPRWSSIIQSNCMSSTSGISCWRWRCSHVFLPICYQCSFDSMMLFLTNPFIRFCSKVTLDLLILKLCFFIGLFSAFDQNGDNHIDFKEISCGVSACCRGPVAERQKCKYFIKL